MLAVASLAVGAHKRAPAFVSFVHRSFDIFWNVPSAIVALLSCRGTFGVRFGHILPRGFS
jgi:hypothetical protein